MAAMGDADLSFTPPEAAEALAVVGKGDADAESVVQATGGWVTGVLFEAWRSAEHVPGMGGEADPLHGYLSAQILAELCPADRDFLVETAVLHEVSPVRAAALGRADAGERLASLRTAHLPFAWMPGQLAMRCHPRFHEYLVARLERRPAEEVRALRLAHGRLLADEGLHEEATDELLVAGAPRGCLRERSPGDLCGNRTTRLRDRRALVRGDRRAPRRVRLGRGRAAAGVHEARLREQPAHQRPLARARREGGGRGVVRARRGADGLELLRHGESAGQQGRAGGGTGRPSD